MNCSLLIVASVSKWTNMTVLNHNIAAFDSSWECLIFGHETPNFANIPERCNSVVLHGTRWAEVMHRGAHIINSYECGKHLLMLDDVRIDPDRFSVRALENYANKHILDITSPMVKQATHPWMGDCAHKVEFIEIYVTLFTNRAWKSFQKLIKFLPGIGWGYDICLARHYRSGIDCRQHVIHMGHRSLVSFGKLPGKEMRRIMENCSSNVRL